MCCANWTYPPASKPHTAQTYSDPARSDDINAGGGGNGGRCGSVPAAPGNVLNAGGLGFTGGSWSLADIGRQLALPAAPACDSGGLVTPMGGVHMAAFTSAAPVASASSDVTSTQLVGCLWVPGVVPAVTVAADLAEFFGRARDVGEPGSNGTAPPSGMLPSGLRT